MEDINSKTIDGTDDLFPSKAYVLVARYESKQVLHVWIGEEFEIPERFEGEAESFAQFVSNDIRNRVAGISNAAEMVLELEDDESEDFFSAFKDG